MPTATEANSGDDRGRDQRPASHLNNEHDDADERVVDRSYAPQPVRFSPSFGVVTDRHR
jgi:hypothetical protein